jgi:DNA-binding Lrp family transcriptional regulator
MEVNGFTPIIDAVLQDTDLITASVFGIMWRYCQMESSECYASIQKIADRLKLSYKTVQRRIDKLVVLGYLEDVTPHLRYSPHTYRDTGKASVRSSMIASVDDAILDQDHPHTAYKGKHMDVTLENVVEGLNDIGELTPHRYNKLENKLNPSRAPKKKMNWYEEKAKFQAGRSECPPG